MNVSVTMQDVADHAGVSRATVSRVLNNHPNVTEDVRRRVQEAMQRLGYQPNRSARKLRSNTSTVIALLIPDIQNPLFISLVRGIEDTAYEHQMNVVLCNTDDNSKKQQEYLSVMQAEQVAGMIIVPTHPRDGETLRAVAAHTPIVLVDRQVNHFATDMVRVDNVRGAIMAIQYLLSLGYRRIAMIEGLQHLTPGRERSQGYYDALNAAGCTIDPKLVKQGDFQAESAYQATIELMTSANPPDAIFSANSLMSLGVMRAARHLGLRIPLDFALVGFDDMPWAEDLCPPITVVAQPAYQIGQEAVYLLVQRLAKPKANFRTVILEPELVIRESCMKPAAKDRS